MKSYEFNFKDGEGIKIHAYKWMPEESEIRAVVQLVHGMEEVELDMKGSLEN